MLIIIKNYSQRMCKNDVRCDRELGANAQHEVDGIIYRKRTRLE